MFLTDLKISTKFNLLTITLVMFASIGIGSIVAYNTIQSYYAELVEDGKSFSLLLAQNSEYAVYTEDETALESIEKSINADKEIAYIFVLDRYMNVIAQNTKTPDAPLPVAMTNNYKGNIPFIKKVKGRSGINEYIAVLTPIASQVIENFYDPLTGKSQKSGQEELLGYINLGLSLSGLRAFAIQYIYLVIIIITIFAARDPRQIISVGL